MKALLWLLDSKWEWLDSAWIKWLLLSMLVAEFAVIAWLFYERPISRALERFH